MRFNEKELRVLSSSGKVIGELLWIVACLSPIGYTTVLLGALFLC